MNSTRKGEKKLHTCSFARTGKVFAIYHNLKQLFFLKDTRREEKNAPSRILTKSGRVSGPCQTQTQVFCFFFAFFPVHMVPF